MECTGGKLKSEELSNLNPILDLPKTSPAGTDQVLWRDNEKIGDRRENYRTKPPKVLTTAETSQLKIPEWLEKGTIRCDSDVWSDASSDAEDVASLGDLASFSAFE